MLLVKFQFYFANIFLLFLSREVLQKKMHLKYMFLKFIEPATVMPNSIANIPMVIPIAPILSDANSA